MAFTRREVLWGIGGGLTGLAATPLPWKLLDDLSIWTQHRGALPVPPQGEVTYRETACSLCPAGCALRMRLVGGRPVSAVGARHPLGNGACALGLTVHHLALHPLRIGRPAQRRASQLHFAPAPAHAFPRLRRKDGSERRHSHAILIFDEPVRGPILIGAGRYRGYGLCRPLEVET